MKKNYVLWAILIAFLLTSCGREDMSYSNKDDLRRIQLSNDEIVSIAFDNTGEINEEGVRNIIAEFLNAQVGTELTTRGLTSSESFDVNSKYYIAQNGKTHKLATLLTRSNNEEVELEVPIYEVFINRGSEKGFALVSGDERSPKVIAYIPNINNEANLKTKEIQIVLGLSKASLLSDIQKIENIRLELREQTLAKISQELNIPVEQINYEDIIQYISIDDDLATRAPADNRYTESQIPTQILSYVDPMSKTAWEQDSPYNRALPDDKILILDQVKDGKRIAGCGVVAIAELFAVVRPTNTFNGVAMDWNVINNYAVLKEAPAGFDPSNNSPANVLNMVGNLIKAIYVETDTKPTYSTYNGQQYNDGSSTPPGNLAPYIRGKINTDAARVFDPDICKSSLDLIRPVFIYGNIKLYPDSGNTSVTVGHAFQIDGYAVAKKSTKILLQSYDIYWHVNCGWGPFAKCYFKISADTNCTMVIEADEGMIEMNTNSLNMLANCRK